MKTGKFKIKVEIIDQESGEMVAGCFDESDSFSVQHGDRSHYVCGCISAVFDIARAVAKLPEFG